MGLLFSRGVRINIDRNRSVSITESTDSETVSQTSQALGESSSMYLCFLSASHAKCNLWLSCLKTAGMNFLSLNSVLVCVQRYFQLGFQYNYIQNLSFPAYQKTKRFKDAHACSIFACMCIRINLIILPFQPAVKKYRNNYVIFMCTSVEILKIVNEIIYSSILIYYGVYKHAMFGQVFIIMRMCLHCLQLSMFELPETCT